MGLILRVSDSVGVWEEFAFRIFLGDAEAGGLGSTLGESLL